MRKQTHTHTQTDCYNPPPTLRLTSAFIATTLVRKHGVKFQQVHFLLRGLST